MSQQESDSDLAPVPVPPRGSTTRGHLVTFRLGPSAFSALAKLAR